MPRAVGGVPSIHPLKKIEKRIQDMLAVNGSIPKICESLDMSEMTLYRHYNHIIKKFDRTAGRKAHEPTDETRAKVKLYTAAGIPVIDMAKMLDISPNMLRSHYERELEVGELEAHARVAANIIRMATGPVDQRNTAIMAQFYAKTRMKWVEVSRVEQTGADGGPIQTEQQVVVILPDNGRDKTIDGAVADIVDALPAPENEYDQSDSNSSDAGDDC